MRIGIGSFDPRFHVKDTTVLLTEDLGKEPNEYQGNWIPHKLRRATEGGVFFAGDSAGHCLPLTAEGIRTALYFGIALGRELRGVVEGAPDPRAAAAPLRRVQRLPRVEVPLDAAGPEAAAADPGRGLQRLLIRLCGDKRFVDWSFGHYLRIAPPEFAGSADDQQRCRPAAGRPRSPAPG